MREVDCLCGERIVFLDDDLQVKTCPNCGAPVYQHAAPGALKETVKLRRRLSRPAAGYWMAGFLGIVLLAVVIFSALSVARSKAISRASTDEKRGDAARLTGDLYIAAEAYGRALKAYRKWGSGSESVARIENALAEVEAALAQQTSAAESPRLSGMLPISFEELARQAYMSGPESWRNEFRGSFARRWAFLEGRVAACEGGAQKASPLTVSYRVFSPEGRAIGIVFDEPFFERYRMAAGEECLVRAVMGEMLWEGGTAARPGRWLLLIDASESELVTDTEDLRATGWEPDEVIRELVARQSSLSAAF